MENQQDIQLLTIEQLGGILQKSPHSIRHDLSRNPKSLPPLVRIPGVKRNLWRVSDVRVWMDALVQVASPQPISQPAGDGKRRPGRPTKSEALARARAAKKTQMACAQPTSQLAVTNDGKPHSGHHTKLKSRASRERCGSAK